MRSAMEQPIRRECSVMSNLRCCCHTKDGSSSPCRRLLLARLHGERLGEWEAAAEVAEGVLGIEPFNPWVRIEAHRLLGRGQAALGRRSEAFESVERAAAEAVGARCVWFEFLSLRDALKWCGPSDAPGVRSRLAEVLGRLKATEEELAGVVGEAVMVEKQA